MSVRSGNPGTAGSRTGRHPHPTSRDVAKLAGVSRTTVSFVLNGLYAAQIPPATRQRVLDAARHLGYRPNALARSLVRGRTETIGVVVRDIANPVAACLVQALEDEAEQAGFAVLLGDTRDNEEREKRLLNHLLARRVDGLVFFVGRRAEDSILSELAEERVPWVWIDAVREPTYRPGTSISEAAAGPEAGPSLETHPAPEAGPGLVSSPGVGSASDRGPDPGPSPHSDAGACAGLHDPADADRGGGSGDGAGKTPGGGDYVLTDNRLGGRIATEYLLSLGHRRIAFVTNSIDVTRGGGARYLGYLDALTAAGLDPGGNASNCGDGHNKGNGGAGGHRSNRDDRVSGGNGGDVGDDGHGDKGSGFGSGAGDGKSGKPEDRAASTWVYVSDPVQANEVVAAIFARPEAQRPTAIFAASDSIALALLQALTRQGWRCPDHVSLIAYDDTMSRFGVPPLTSISPRVSFMAATAFRLLSERMADPALPTRQVVVNPVVVERESTSPPDERLAVK
ncbi:MAG TPA: LacI family transcriptional regulator [Firmicutes bacterium]|nr:LacI family transcriptional regulator [Bacillota bacterium]